MFSVNKYGEQKAFQLACEWRKKMESEIYGHSWVKPPEKVPQYTKVSDIEELENTISNSGN